MTKTRTSQLRLDRPWLLGAHLQEKGRGRAGRTWQNRAGANLMFSCAFDVFLSPKLLPALSPLAGIAACEALRELLPPAPRQHLTLKWPNDLPWKIGRASCRERVCQYVSISGVAVSYKNKTKDRQNT